MTWQISKPNVFVIAFGLTLPLGLPACQSDVALPHSATGTAATNLVTIAGATMGTTYHVKLMDPQGQKSTNDWQQKFDTQLEQINQLMSTYRPDSEISRFNTLQSTDWFPVSEETLSVITKAQQISKLTAGAFDVTVGPLVDLWNFGPNKKTRAIPDDAAIQNILQQIGYQQLEVRAAPPALRKTVPGLRCDLSAIAKGYAVDQLCELIEAEQIRDYMVEIGGEVRTAGTKAEGNPWLLGIAAPTENQIALQRVIQMTDQALATSGNYRNYYEIDGKRYSHTIDPRTGQPVEFEMAAVSVLADRCMDADAWATAIMVLGPEAGYNLAVEQHLEVFLLLRQDDKIIERMTPGFGKQLVDRTRKRVN